MFYLKRFTPFFNLDGGASDGGGSDLSGDWGSIAANAMSDSPVDDGQAYEEAPDTEGLDDTDPLTDAEDEVEPDSDDTEQDEEPADTEQEFGDDTEIDLGEGRQPVKLAELKQGYLRQSDYTKKTQELANQRKEVETMQEQLAPIKGMNDFLQTNPWLNQQINEFIKEFQNTGAISLDEVLADAQYGQYVNHLMAENHRLSQELGTIKGEYEGVKLTSEMNTLRSDLVGEYGDLVTDDYISTLQERGKTENLSTATLKEIAEGHLTKQMLQQTKASTKKTVKETQARTVQQLQERRSAVTPAPRSTGQRPGRQTADIGSLSWGDLARTSME